MLSFQLDAMRWREFRSSLGKSFEMQFQGKKGLIFGVANDNSIAWAIAQEIMNAGGVCGFTHLPDREDDEQAGTQEFRHA